MADDQSRPVAVYVLILFMLFQGLSGLAGGAGLVLDPTGESLKLPLSWLDDSPFNNYLIPGLILLIVLGLLPIAVCYGLWRKSRGSWFGALLVGAALIIWIAVQILVVGYHSQPPLQLIYGSVGLIVLILVFIPTVRDYCLNSQHDGRRLSRR